MYPKNVSEYREIRLGNKAQLDHFTAASSLIFLGDKDNRLLKFKIKE